MEARLWALDEVDDALAAWTLGLGTGGRFELLNRLIADVGSDWVAVLDDDVTFVRGNLVHLVKLSACLGFDLAQPSHTLGSRFAHGITAAHPGLAARLTTFVEIGPVFVLSPEMRVAVVPFPERTPMGWGVDVGWTECLNQGRRFGVVDAVRILHRDAIASGYVSGRPDEEAALRDALMRRGVEKPSDLQHLVACLRPWQVFRRRNGTCDG